eukprot:TRINITY_DN12696_c0_g1_i1.p1 TRINITY_DN12696_c0_g1~~TRINITY_DN12696_c0_g1_i1.p1  ORF type:complete len:278 (-),score=50.56 TRINITY_DN12696_c0_g1_i1:174-1007(-)
MSLYTGFFPIHVAKETFNESKALVGTTVPRRPRAEEAVTTRPPPTRPHEATSGLRLGQSCGRPGDAPNQVYVQFSNDLEGWLPYTLLISEEEGLMFKSLSLSPDFTLSIRSIRKVEITSMFAIQQDAFFGNHTRSVIAHLMQGSGYEADDDTALAHVRRVDQERVRPPYNAVVQLLCSNFTSEVVVFVAVQSDALAAELTRSCNATRKRCATKKVFMANQDEYDFDPLVNDLDNGSGYFSRGCPTTRSMGATTPGTGTGAAATPLLGSRTPMKIPEL